MDRPIKDRPSESGLHQVERPAGELALNESALPRLSVVFYWVMLIVATIIGINSLVRIAVIQSSNYDDLELDEGYRLESIPVTFGRPDLTRISAGDRLLRVNGIRLEKSGDYVHGRSTSEQGITRLVFGRPPDLEEVHIHLVIQSPTPILYLNEKSMIIASRNVNLESLGVQLGDQVKTLDGKPVEGARTVGTAKDSPALLTHMLIHRENQPVPELEVVFLRMDYGVPWAHLFLGAVFTALGALVYRLKPMRKTSWGFLIFCTYMGIFYFLRAIPPGFRSAVEGATFQAHLGFIFFPVMMLISTYTPLRRYISNLLRFALIAFAVGVVMSTFSFWIETRRFFIAWGILLLGLLFVTTFMDKIFKVLKLPLDAVDLQRSGTMRLALTLAFLPSILYLILRMSTATGAEFQFWFDLTPFFFPAILGYAIVRQNFLRINELLIEGLVFSLLMVFVGGTYGVIIGSAGPLLARVSPNLSPIAIGVLTGVLAAISMPTYARIRRWLERYYERQQARYDELIRAIENEDYGFASLESYCGQLSEKLKRLAETPHVRILACLPQSGQFRLLATTDHSEDIGIFSENQESMVRFLERRQNGLYREDYEDSLLQNVNEKSLADFMTRLQAIMLFPIMVENHLAAVLTLGNKVTKRNYSHAEISKIRHVARCMTVGFYGFAMQKQTAAKAETEKALVRSEERLKLIANNAQDVIYRYSVYPNPTVDYISPSVEKFTDIEQGKFLTTPDTFFSILHPEDTAVLQTLIARMPESPQEIELRWISRDGRTFWMEQRIVPIRDSAGRFVAIEGIARDVTERKLAQERQQTLEAQLRQAQKLEAVGTLASGIAHDIGNLLTAISGFTSIARTTLPLDHPASESLQNVEEAASRAGGISKSLLTFTQEVKATMKPFNLTQLLINSTRMLRRFLPASVEVLEDYDRENDIWIDGDENQIHQVIFNLVINARDAMLPKGGTLRMSLAREGSTSESTAVALLCVEDMGEGIPPELLDRIFEPFFTTKPAGHGTGLGLAVTHGIVTKHGGTITIKPATDHGTRFEVRLTACDPSDHIEMPHQIPQPESGAGELIIVAEDDPMVRQLVGLRLKDLHYQVETCSDGGEFAFSFAKRGNQASAVILDVDLPVSNGLSCMRIVRDASATLPIILMTANPSEEIENLLDEHTILLRKPFPINALADLISRRSQKVDLEVALETQSE